MDDYKSKELNEVKFISFINKSINKPIISNLSVFFQKETCLSSWDNFWEAFISLEKEEGTPVYKKKEGIIPFLWFKNKSFLLKLNWIWL